ncbi:hypothetical protein EDD17DRAFT_1562282, partial [Pisolithus thermaeus]
RCEWTRRRRRGHVPILAMAAVLVPVDLGTVLLLLLLLLLPEVMGRRNCGVETIWTGWGIRLRMVTHRLDLLQTPVYPSRVTTA